MDARTVPADWDFGKLVFHAEGVPRDAAARGLEAALEILRAANVSPAQAFAGAWSIHLWDELGFPQKHQPTDEDGVWADAWRNALEAAQVACFGMVNPPNRFMLDVVFTDEERERWPWPPAWLAAMDAEEDDEARPPYRGDDSSAPLH